MTVNKLPQDWCGQEIPIQYEKSVAPKATIVAQETTYDIYTDEVKPKRGRKNGTKGTSE
jgi:hypothetical protein